MTYKFKKSDGQDIEIQDGIVDRRFSASLIGNSSEEYVSDFSQTLVQLTENFSSVDSPDINPFVNFDNKNDISTNPREPLVGQLWYDFFNRKLKVYNTLGAWDDVSTDAVSRDLIPEFDGELDFGKPDAYWYNLYITNVNLTTNRFLNQEGVGDPDGNPALTVDGNIILESENESTKNFIFEGKYDIGSKNNPFNLTYTEKIFFGESAECGFKFSNEGDILPASLTNSANVNIGTEGKPALSTSCNELSLKRISSFSPNKEIDFSGNLASNDNSISLGTTQKVFSEINAKEVNVNLFKPLNGTFNTTDNIIKKLHVSGFKSLPNTNINKNDSTTKVIVKKQNGNYAKIPYENILPVGSIFMWGFNKDEIPSGWKICDGNNGTPNLKDRFVVGAEDLGDIGETNASDNSRITTGGREGFGAESKFTITGGLHNHDGATSSDPLTTDQLPVHSHEYGRNTVFDSNEGESAQGGGDDDRYKRDNFFESGVPLVGTSGNNLFTDSSNTQEGHSHDILDGGSHVHPIEDFPDHTHTFSMEDIPQFQIIYIMKVQ